MSKSIQFTAAEALHLVELIQQLAKQTESEAVQRILLRAGIKIADLAIAADKSSNRIRRAA